MPKLPARPYLTTRANDVLSLALDLATPAAADIQPPLGDIASRLRLSTARLPDE